MTNVIQNLIAQADAMSLVSISGNGTASTEHSIGNIRVYRERNVKCVNMKRQNLKTSYKLNDKVISSAKLEELLK